MDKYCSVGDEMFLKVKRAAGKQYFALCESVRRDNKIATKTIVSLGNADKALLTLQTDYPNFLERFHEIVGTKINVGTKKCRDKVFAVIKDYLINYKSTVDFPFEFDDYRQILNEKTRIAVTCVTFNLVDMVFYNGSVVYDIRFFKSGCIIKEWKDGTRSHGVWYDICFKNYNEVRELKLFEEFLDWYSK